MLKIIYIPSGVVSLDYSNHTTDIIMGYYFCLDSDDLDEILGENNYEIIIPTVEETELNLEILPGSNLKDRETLNNLLSAIQRDVIIDDLIDETI